MIGWVAFGSLAGLLGGLILDVIALPRVGQAIHSQNWTAQPQNPYQNPQICH